MFNWSIIFAEPIWLYLLLLIPLAWWMSWQSLSGLGKRRRWLALGLRTVVLLIVICCLAEPQIKYTSEKVTVIYLLDQSVSIPEDQRRFMIRYVNQEVHKHRQEQRADRAAVIVFAREAVIEHPPHARSMHIPEVIESRIENDATNLADALKLAQAALPEDSAGRIVILCDGNENVGDARAQAQHLADAGVGIDVVPVHYNGRSEIAVEKIAIPPDVNRGQPFELRVVVNNMSPPDAKGKVPTIAGKLKVIRRTGTREVVLNERQVEVPSGKHVFALREEIDAAEFYTYEARFTADQRMQDTLSQNNMATSFTHVAGRGQVLLYEYVNEDLGVTRGAFDFLVERLKQENLQVTVRSTSELFQSLGELQPFDCVVLGNCPREVFTEEQLSMLVQNTREMGAGLIVLGGEHSYGAGGWGGSTLEEALPVECQIRNAKVNPVGALALVIDRSGSMGGDKLVMAKRAALAAVDVLSPQDYVHVEAFDSSSETVVQLTQNTNSTAIKRKIERIDIGGGTDIAPGVIQAHAALKNAKVAGIKHMVILTDGQTSNPAIMPDLIRKARADKITVSTVAIGDGADTQLMSSLAQIGGGKFHFAKSPKVLPRIFQQEARLVSRPLIYEHPGGMVPNLKYSHEILKGIEPNFPPLTGYVRTTLKESSLVELALVAPQPSDGGEKYNTLLAAWNYGLGKVVCWTSDTGRKWANAWSNWENYDRLFSQMVRWSMRPAGDTGKFTVNTELVDGKVRVIMTALDKDDEFLNFLSLGNNVVGPDMKPVSMNMEQVAPGRYVGDFQASASGNYYVMVSPGKGYAPILTGINVPYSREYLDREPNPALLKDLAAFVPSGSQPGTVIEGSSLDQLLETDTFRHNLTKASSLQDAWHWLILCGACLFFADVFQRRVSIDWSWVGGKLATVRNKLLGRAAIPQPVTVVERLRNRQAALANQLEQQRASMRFEITPQQASSVAGSTLDQVAGTNPTAKPRPEQTVNPPPVVEADDAMSRLLRAKKQVWNERQKKPR